MTNDRELLPCPFCGRKATIVMNSGSNWDGKDGEHINIGAMCGLWFVGCSYSFFEGTDRLPECEISPAAKWYAKLDDAVKLWNTRANQAHQ